MLALLACDPSAIDTADTAVVEDTEITGYEVSTWTDPEPLVAGSTGELYVQVTDQDGNPIEDLQQNHDRLVHDVLISADWTFFAHLHHEDYYDVTVDDLKAGTLHVPVTPPLAGRYLVALNWAHDNQWQSNESAFEATGEPPMAAEPDTTPVAEASDEGVTGTLAWASQPMAGYSATWTVTLRDAEGNDVTDIEQYLGADAHAALVNTTLDWVSHTHAYVPGMETMSPSMDMPHLYPGPTVDFRYVFPAGGAYKMWVQLTRASQPGLVYTLPFVFHVEG